MSVLIKHPNKIENSYSKKLLVLKNAHRMRQLASDKCS